MAKKKADLITSAFEGRACSIVVGARTYAVGLVWLQDGQAGEVSAASRAKRAAASYSDADLFAVASAEVDEYALGSTKSGHKTRTYSLAATVRQALEGSVLGAFEVDEGIYLIAIHQEGILSTTDLIIRDKEVARRAFLEMLSGGGWDQKFCPASWEIAGAKPLFLEDLLVEAKPIGQLKPVSNVKKLVMAGVFFAFLGLAYGGYEYYTAWQEEQIALAEADRRAREAAEERAARLAAAKALPPYVWSGKVVGQVSLALCAEAILAAPTEVPGWAPLSLVCTGQGAVTMSMSRLPGGTVNWPSVALNRLGFRPSIRQQNSGILEISWGVPLGNSPKHPNEAQTLGVEQSLRYLATHFEELYVPLQTSISEAPPVQLTDPRNPNRTNPVIMSRTLNFTFSTNEDPRAFLNILAPLPVMTLERISLSLRDWTWKVEGQTHETLYNPNQPGSVPGRSPR